jgi:DnaK suppressor protein
MTDADIGRLRYLLRTKQTSLEELLAQRDGIEVQRTADPSDEAQSALDRELTICALDRKSRLLTAIRVALQRIDEGTYGLCLACEGDISIKRLSAIPWATFCIRCQEEIDQTVPERHLDAVGAF